MTHAARLLALLLLPMTGCSGLGAGDYFAIAEGNTWSYFVRNSELTDERWTLDVLDSEENEQGDRGQLFFRLVRSYKDAVNPAIEYTERLRGFNVTADTAGQGEDADVVAWVYKQVNADEGGRNENFIIQPGTGADWTASWEYEVEGQGGGSDFNYLVELSYATQAIQTSVGNFEDTLYVRRERSAEALTNVREEWWAVDIGLVQYRETASTGDFIEGVLRSTNTDDE